MTTTQTSPAPPQQSGRRMLLELLTDLVLPTVLYYVLRSTGMGMYLSLLISAAIPAAIAVVRLIRNRRVDGVALYAVTVMVLGAVVSLIAGSPRFMLAREGWLTGITGLWFLVSVRFGRRPLAFLYSRPVLERRLTRRGVPGDWEQLWEQLPASAGSGAWPPCCGGWRCWATRSCACSWPTACRSTRCPRSARRCTR